MDGFRCVAVYAVCVVVIGVWGGLRVALGTEGVLLSVSLTAPCYVYLPDRPSYVGAWYPIDSCYTHYVILIHSAIYFSFTLYV